MIRRAFFWIVDVVPADGDNAEEAREVVLRGRIMHLSKKLVSDTGNMTLEEGIEFSRMANWRANLLFNARQRLGKRVTILYRYHSETGRQPQELRTDEIKKLGPVIN